MTTQEIQIAPLPDGFATYDDYIWEGGEFHYDRAYNSPRHQAWLREVEKTYCVECRMPHSAVEEYDGRCVNCEYDRRAAPKSVGSLGEPYFAERD